MGIASSADELIHVTNISLISELLVWSKSICSSFVTAFSMNVLWNRGSQRHFKFNALFFWVFFLKTYRPIFELGVPISAITSRWSETKSKLLYTRQFLTYWRSQLQLKRLRLKNSWKQRPLSFTTRSSIKVFSRSDELYKVADEVALKSPRQITFRVFSQTVCLVCYKKGFSKR